MDEECILERGLFSMLDPDSVLLILKKWVKSEKEWATAKLTSKSWQLHSLCDVSCETLTLHGFSGDPVMSCNRGTTTTCPLTTVERMKSLLTTIKNGKFCNLHTLELSYCGTYGKLPKSEHSDVWEEWWEISSQPNSGTQLFKELLLMKSWPFSGPSTRQILLAFPNLTSLTFDIHKAHAGGAIPEEVGSLQELCILHFHEIATLENLPKSLTNLVKLEELHIKIADEVTNTIHTLPDGIGNLMRLKVFSLCSSTIEELPDSFSSLLNLEKIALSECVSLVLPESLTNLTNLRTFEFDLGPQDVDALPIWRITSLESLDINTEDSDNFLEELHFMNFPNLTSLFVKHSACPFPEAFAHLPLLQHIYLRLGDENVPLGLAQLQNLTYLSVTESCPDFSSWCCGDLASLLELDLWDCQLEEVPEFIGGLVKLTYLDLGSNPISELNDNLRRVSKLERLDLSSTHVVVFPDVLTKLSNLSSLTITLDCDETTPESPFCLPEDFGGLSSLRTLNLGRQSVKELPESLLKLTSLRSLSLQHCNLTCLPETLGHLMHLSSLDVVGNKLKEIPTCVFQLPCLEY